MSEYAMQRLSNFQTIGIMNIANRRSEGRDATRWLHIFIFI